LHSASTDVLGIAIYKEAGLHWTLMLVLLFLSSGVPQKQVIFKTPTGNATVITDAQGRALHKVTATAAGPLAVTAEYFNSKTFETTILPLEVEVEPVSGQP
jgi:hypothetical protein